MLEREEVKDWCCIFHATLAFNLDEKQSDEWWKWKSEPGSQERLWNIEGAVQRKIVSEDSYSVEGGGMQVSERVTIYLL